MTYTLSKVMMCGSVIDRQHLDGLSSSMTTYNENWQINSTIGQFKFKSCYNKCMKMFLIIPRCTVLLLFYWSWSCPVLIQLIQYSFYRQWTGSVNSVVQYLSSVGCVYYVW